ncbi:1-phosphatidylinositol-4,5-bisphosphate phosphodiesterase gamma 2 like protein [Zymoseptoria brevis]|uniref:Phosphoinositide phospholipase C n=1 Tax=Zymoseptoria brevis TaxID=1047168 RepID=A0A0F4GH31_9PEZI|nr:1-phosphatidylinositol-4,5-bisphosphate phosphodiesterase gamma 2 like protein [Zymoseptoria brevis]
MNNVTNMTSGLASTLSKLSPFVKSSRDEDDYGEEVGSDSVAGGGHASRASKITKEELFVSRALKKFIIEEKILGEHEVNLREVKTTGALKELLDKPHVHVPRELTDRSHPLTEYFISSSHNTYLLAHQLYGTSSAVAYEISLKAGARCVEIDAWDNDDDKDEPKVTHGYTLTSNIPFRKVCETIRDVYDSEQAEGKLQSGYAAAPIMLSLENHCGAHGQARLAAIMKEVWADRLLSKRIRDEGTRETEHSGEHVNLAEMGSKIAVIVEYHLPGEADSDDETEDDEPQDVKDQRHAYQQQKKESPKGVIIPELAELGVYAQSVKPSNNSWFESELQDRPHNHLINVSESGLAPLMAHSSPKISKHNSQHLMRVYPKGIRISSKNLNPVPFWGIGAQICALNWQTFDASMQLNEALFAGTDGYVLKPVALRAGGSGTLNSGKKQKLQLRIAGASDLSLPKGREADDIKPYVTCTLVHPDDTDNEPPKRKTSGYHQHKLGLLHKGENPANTDPIWNETLEWTYEENELTFLRILIKSDDSWARNPVFAVATVRLLYVEGGWTFIRMLDLKGRETHCTLFVNIKVTEA